MSFIDSHCHLTDPRLLPQIEQILLQARQKGIGFFLQGGVGPEDWHQQKLLQQRYPQLIGNCFGLHPYWVAEHNLQDCEAGLDQLARLLPQAVALGELGLDFRPHIVKDSAERQLTFFENQLELAIMANKPIVLHIVSAHQEAQKVLDLWGVPPAGGMVHSFNGSFERAQEYLRRGLMISIGGAVTYEKNHKLRLAAQRIPLEFLLLETDSPDQPPANWGKEYNTPESLIEVAATIGFLRGIEAEEVLSICAENVHRLFRV